MCRRVFEYNFILIHDDPSLYVPYTPSFELYRCYDEALQRDKLLKIVKDVNSTCAKEQQTADQLKASGDEKFRLAAEVERELERILPSLEEQAVPPRGAAGGASSARRENASSVVSRGPSGILMKGITEPSFSELETAGVGALPEPLQKVYRIFSLLTEFGLDRRVEVSYVIRNHPYSCEMVDCIPSAAFDHGADAALGMQLPDEEDHMPHYTAGYLKQAYVRLNVFPDYAGAERDPIGLFFMAGGRHDETMQRNAGGGSSAGQQLFAPSPELSQSEVSEQAAAVSDTTQTGLVLWTNGKHADKYGMPQLPLPTTSGPSPPRGGMGGAEDKTANEKILLSGGGGSPVVVAAGAAQHVAHKQSLEKKSPRGSSPQSPQADRRASQNEEEQEMEWVVTEDVFNFSCYREYDWLDKLLSTELSALDVLRNVRALEYHRR